MRQITIEAAHKIMKTNPKSYFLVGDLGYHAVEEIEKEFPTRFINMGVAEQNMIGVAAGLALNENKVFVYSIIPFLTMRPFEQIRNDLCYQNLDVVLIGAGAGLSYGILGPTHFAMEDVAIMRALPNMTVFSPADETEAVLGMKQIEKLTGPVYFRTGGRTEPVIFEKPYEFTLGRGVVVREGREVVMIASGPILKEALNAAEQLASEGVEIGVVNIHTIKPFDTELIQKISQKAKLVVTVEEHFLVGGLGSAVAEVMAESGSGAKLVRMGVDDQFVKHTGSQKYLRKVLGLDATGIIKKIKENI
jgi:transketolase